MSKLLLIILIALVLGLLLAPLIGKIPFLGKLPGDFHIQRKNITICFPLATSLILSVVLSLVLNWLMRK